MRIGHEKARRRDLIKNPYRVYGQNRNKKSNLGRTQPFKPGMYEGKTLEEIRAVIGSSYKVTISHPSAMSRNRRTAHRPGSHQRPVPSERAGVKPTCLEPWCSSIATPNEGSAPSGQAKSTPVIGCGLTAADIKGGKTG